MNCFMENTVTEGERNCMGMHIKPSMVYDSETPCLSERNEVGIVKR